MKRRALKRRISEAFSSSTPDICDRVIRTCKGEAQLPAMSAEAEECDTPSGRVRLRAVFKWAVAIAVCLAIFVSGASLGYYLPRGNGEVCEDSTLVYIDVNPSIELTVDNERRVVGCEGANEDAVAILSDLELNGVSLNTALTAIVGAMYVNGYLTTDSNSILVSVEDKNEEESTLLSDITEKINSVFEKAELECSIIAQNIEINDSLKQRAEENGVSVGKMHLVDKMVGAIDDFTEDDASSLSDMSIKELNLIYSTRPNRDDEGDRFDKDISSGVVGGFVEANEAFGLLLTELGLTDEDIEWRDIHARPQRTEGITNMVYKISLCLVGDDNVYSFEVDCESGEVIKIDEGIKGPDREDRPGDKSEESTPPNDEGDEPPVGGGGKMDDIPALDENNRHENAGQEGAGEENGEGAEPEESNPPDISENEPHSRGENK